VAVPRVTVRLFASLAEREGWREKVCDLPADATVRDAWQLTTGQAAVPARTLVAVNHDYTPLHATLSEGDEVAFFPPVTGG
jgi:molybdopterin synthase sulfur carrier subunit